MTVMRWAWMVVPWIVTGCAATRPAMRTDEIKAAPVAPAGVAAQAQRAAPAEDASLEVEVAAPRVAADEDSLAGETELMSTGARSKKGARIAARAARLVGVRNLSQVSSRVPDDCTGVVRIAAEPEGVVLTDGNARVSDNGVTAIYRRARSRGAVHQKNPRPGDLVFFRETYDRNRDGKRNDGLTHIGVVESVSRDGTVVFVHRGNSGVHRSRMNLRAPRDKRLNDYLRRASGRMRAYLTGELFGGFASPERL